jgi:predicted phage baseplate assembly protein
MEPGQLADQSCYWLRLSLTESGANQGSYYASPIISQLRVEARGGSVKARHAVTTKDEILGRSDGTAGQTFKLQNTPLLTRDKNRDLLVVETAPGQEERWEERDDFAESQEADRHYTLDRLTGELMFGPTLLQPDGKVYSFGAIPPKGAVLRMARYQHGGGSDGNLPAGAIRVMKSSIPYVAHVVNRSASTGGLDPESLESAKLKAPQELRSRTRAVTAEDYEHIAVRTPRVARAHCLAPGAQPRSDNDPPPGHVVVVVIPQATDKLGFQPEQLVLDTNLLQSVTTRLDAHRLLGTTVEVRAPRVMWVSVSATLRVAARTDPAARQEAKEKAEEILYRYLNPYVGGPTGDGWPLGRDLNRAELLGLLQQIPIVEYADQLRVTVAESNAEAVAVTAAQHLAVPFDAVVCSGEHLVKVETARDMN